MVPVASSGRTEGPLLGAVFHQLSSLVGDTSVLEPHVRAFVCWIDPVEHPAPQLSALAVEAAALQGAAFTYKHVALLGFSETALREQSKERERLVEGLVWLSNRRWFVHGRPPTLEADGIGLLGIALALASLPAGNDRDQLSTWLDGMLEQAGRLCANADWEAALIDAARVVASTEHSHRSASGVRVAALAVALAGRGVLQIDEDVETVGLRSIFEPNPGQELGPARAAVHLAALRWLLRAAPRAIRGRATSAQVVELLSEVSHGLRLWTWEEKARKRNAQPVRWEIANEYHVQNLLWAILAPIFPDLENEEYLRSLGHKHPRADLAIPSLKLIVEAKFIYKGQESEFASVIEEIAADAGLYLAGSSPFNALTPFVWDNSGRVESHGELRNGLLRIPGVIGAVIIPRPGKMK